LSAVPDASINVATLQAWAAWRWGAGRAMRVDAMTALGEYRAGKRLVKVQAGIGVSIAH